MKMPPKANKQNSREMTHISKQWVTELPEEVLSERGKIQTQTEVEIQKQNCSTWRDTWEGSFFMVHT